MARVEQDRSGSNDPGAPAPVVLVVEGQAIVRRGLVAALDAVEGFAAPQEAGSVADASRHPALACASIVVLNVDLEGAVEFVSDLARSETRVLALGSRAAAGRLDAAIEVGASAALHTDELTPQTLAIAIRATAAGVPLAHRRPPTAPPPAPSEPHAPLTDRERRVLSLVAEGFATREVALTLHYSERTVKKILRDVVVKLGSRTRSQAIAQAVRDGLI